MTKKVEILAKNFRKTPRTNRENRCKTSTQTKSRVYKTLFQPTFPYFSTAFSTTSKPLYLINLFHYSTYPTTKTTKYNKIIEERKQNEN